MTAMSGSYDRPTGPPTLRQRAEHEAFEPHTGTSGFTTGGGRTGPPKLDPGEGPRTRSRRGDPKQTAAPIVPAGSVTGRSLTLVITIMCFLACLTAGAVYMMNQSASAWLHDIASEVTVQIEVKEQGDVDKLVADVTAYIARQPGIARVHALSAADAAQLLEPWLGQTEALKALPVPRLVAIELDRGAPPDLDKMREALHSEFKGATLDDHRRWQQQIRTITRSFALGGLAILLLVGAATTAIIISATKSAMASNRDIVEVLHFVGAVWAIVVFIAMPTVMELLGGGAVTMAEIRRLIGISTLDAPGHFLLGIVVLVIASLCMLTSRIGVYRILNSQH